MAPTVVETLRVPLTELVEHPENDRRGDLDRVVASLRANGQYRPVVVHQATGRVLAGNHVVRGLRHLVDQHDGEPFALATYVECTEDEARAILLADNHTADDATYDDQATLDIATALEAVGMLAAATFDSDHLDDLRATIEELAVGPSTTGVQDNPTVEGYRENYEASGTRSIVVFLGAEDYTVIVERLGRLRARMGVDSNTEVLVRLIRDADVSEEGTA